MKTKCENCRKLRKEIQRITRAYWLKVGEVQWAKSLIALKRQSDTIADIQEKIDLRNENARLEKKIKRLKHKPIRKKK